ncbi:MAG: cytochrome c [Phycisphaerae bacterium]
MKLRTFFAVPVPMYIGMIAVLGGCVAVSGAPGEQKGVARDTAKRRDVARDTLEHSGAQSAIRNPQSSIPNPQSPIRNRIERLHWEDAIAIKTPVSYDLVELGRRTYNTRCLICHGREGHGDGSAANYLDTKPRDFTKAIFKYRTTPQGSFPRDEDLFRSISVGFPIYGMPSFHYLSARQRWGLVYYVEKLCEAGFRKSLEDDGDSDPDEIKEILDERLTPEKPLDVGNAPEWNDDAIARGKTVYQELQCATCHGDRGMGDGPSANDQTDVWGNELTPVPFALNPYFMKAGGRPRDIVRVLMTGVGGTGMPRFETQNQDDYWKLAYYVLQLADERSEENQ